MTINSSQTGRQEAFALSVRHGLQQSPKQLSSKYFYDQEGDRLFQKIMHMPEYYLTDCEYEIFEQQKGAILEGIGPEAFKLIELGAGDGLKTKVLLRHFLQEQLAFQYHPVDISRSVLQQLQASLARELPQLQVSPMNGEYFEVLEKLDDRRDQQKKVIFFLGANIGNLNMEAAYAFLHQLNHLLNPGDMLFIGFDLKKDPATILAAYNDPADITAAFNLNLLRRINRELGGQFEVDNFKHWESYNPVTGETKSYIVSKLRQEVEISALSQTISFEAWEAIEVQLSQKYSIAEVQRLAEGSGFSVVKHFSDSRSYFVDSLWIKD